MLGYILLGSYIKYNIDWRYLMSLYMSGFLTFFGCGSALAINMDLSGGGGISNPALFWSMSIVFWTCIIIGIVYVATHWDMSYNLPKRRLIYTVICIAMAHVIAWVPANSAWLLIFELSCIDGYMLDRADKARLGEIK
jgi:hypothetical protein